MKYKMANSQVFIISQELNLFAYPRVAFTTVQFTCTSKSKCCHVNSNYYQIVLSIAFLEAVALLFLFFTLKLNCTAKKKKL